MTTYKRRTLALLLGAAVSGCVSPARRTRVAAYQHEAPSAPRAAPDFRQLHEVITGLDVDPVAPAALAQALVVLSSSVDKVDVASSGRGSAIEEVARRLAPMDAHAASATALAKRGIAIICAQLARLAPPAARQLSFEQAVSAAGDAVEGLDAKRALAEQIALVRGGLRAASDAVRLATNQAAWFEGSAPPPRARLGFEDAVTQMRAALLAFADARWSDASDPASRAVSALADLLHASAGCRNATLDRYTTELRFQAGRLRRAENTIGQGGWIKRALAAAMDGLDAVATTKADPGGWRSAARDAIGKIDDRANLAFSRAPVQGAFRATVDATILAFQPACATVTSVPTAQR